MKRKHVERMEKNRLPKKAVLFKCWGSEEGNVRSVWRLGRGPEGLKLDFRACMFERQNLGDFVHRDNYFIARVSLFNWKANNKFA